MKLSVHSSAAYDLPAETFLLMMVEPSLTGPGHRVLDERLVTTPTSFSELWTDDFGNPCRRLVAPAGPFSFEFLATIEADENLALPLDAIEHEPRAIPAEVMVYTLPSRYCQSDRLVRLAQTEFGDLQPGGTRVAAIAKWIREHVEYRYGTTNSSTSAADTAIERVGVCRDFAHLLIALSRALGIPSRYVSGYALGLDPPDFHGFAQVYLGGAWRNVDATTEEVRPALVPIAVGRDAADVAMTTFWGVGHLRHQAVKVEAMSGG